MAVNNNYLLHLLEDPQSGRQIIRIFNRQSNMLSYARYDLFISRETIINEFFFPNPFFNILVIRDERTLNVTQIGEWSLVLNATNSTLVQKYKDIQITALIYTENYEVLNFQNVKINFLDNYNTTIFS
jgi:hypothetical protein